MWLVMGRIHAIKPELEVCVVSAYKFRQKSIILDLSNRISSFQSKVCFPFHNIFLHKTNSKHLTCQGIMVISIKYLQVRDYLAVLSNSDWFSYPYS